MIVEVYSGMSLADVAMRWYGSVDAIAEIAKLNDLSLDWVAKENCELNVREVSNRVVNEYNKMNIVICTGEINQ